MFGQSTSTSTFGQPSAFNTSATPFGNIGNTQQQQSSLFGQTTQQTSLFGGAGMSQPATSSLFGTPQNQPQANTFGTQSAFGGSSLFGNAAGQQTAQQQQQSSIFGNANRFSVGTSNAFGTSTALGTSMNVPTGTTIKFQPQSSTDTIMKNGHTQSTSINIRLQCITCMREYETKSLEELRMEDYAAGRKGPQQQTGLFGTSTMNPSGTSAFGTGGIGGTQPNAFGQTTGGGLFSNTQKPFGSIVPTTTSTTSIFNSGLTSSTGLFGQTTTQPTFGQTDNKATLSFFTQQPSSTNQTMNQPFSFGQTTLGTNQSSTSNSLFGNTGTGTTGSFFGQTQNSLTGNKPMFGSSLTPFGQTQPQQQQTSTNIFGANNPTGQNTGIFGAGSLQQSVFNNANNSSLGKPNLSFTFPQTQTLNQTSTFNPSTSTTTGLFGSTGATTNNAFGTGNTGSLFGTSTLGSNTFGSFGTGNTGTQPFGNTNTNFNFNLGGGTNTFGSTTGTNAFQTSGLSTGGLFGNATNQAQQSAGVTASVGTSVPPAVNTDQIITRLQTLPYGTPPPLSLDSSLQNNSKTKFTTDPKTLNQYKLNAKSQTEVNKVQRAPVSGKPTTLLFDGLDDESPENLKSAADIFKPRQNIKKLILNKSTSNNNSNNNQLSASILKTSIVKSSPAISSVTKSSNQNSFNKENESPSNTSTLSRKDISSSSLDNTMNYINKISQNDVASKDFSKDSIQNFSSKTIASHEKSPMNLYGPLNFSTNSIVDSHETSTVSNFVPPKCGVILTRADYYTIPSLDECDQFYNSDDDSCVVESFTVGRLDYGSIYWRGPLNIKGINLDEVVHIRRKEVIVYPDDDLKPPIMEGLNRPAQITLDQVWPIDKTTREFIKDPERLRVMKYAERLEKTTVKLDATYKEYRPDTGSWVFVVKHFSKYGLDAEDEDIEVIESVKGDQEKLDGKKKAQQTFVKQPFEMNNSKSNVHLNGFNSLDIQMIQQQQQQPIDRQHPDNFTSKNLFDSIQDSLITNARTNENIEPKFLSGFYKYDATSASNQSFNSQAIEDHQSQNTLMKTKDEEYNLMRSTLFVDEDEIETMAKKCKNLSFNKTASQVSQMTPSSTLFANKFINSTIPKKRRLTFEQQKPASQQKANVYSFSYSECPKVRFINGSNKFCLIFGSDVLIFQVDLLCLDQSESIKKLEQHLDRHSTIQKLKHIQKQDESLVPLIKTNAYNLNPMVDSNMNSLIEALYGELSETHDYARHQERLRRILKWLFNFNKSLAVPESSYNRIVHFLTTNELEFAITECINSKLPRLSYLVSCGPYCKKEFLIAQLDLWKRSEADVFIDKDLLKIYVILSGLSSWNMSNGKSINSLEGLQWTQQLSLLLLYKTRSGSEMIGTNLVKTAIEELTCQPNVVEYHMLAQHQPWVAITSAKNLLDSWFLQETLQSYNVIIDDAITNKCDSINMFMASQTRDLCWTLFFALHIKNDFLRCSYVKELLTRNAEQLLDQNLEHFLMDKYHIDLRLLAEAKLYLAKTNRNYREMAMSLLEIGHFKEAHEILVDQIFPELVINEDYKEIFDLIDKLRPHQHLITNWDFTGAGIYDIFIQLLQFGQLESATDSTIQHYRQLIENFNVHQLNTPTNRHVLCQSQMARVANIIHAELNKGMFAYHTAVPHDYSLLELRSNAYKLYELKAINCSSP